MLCIALSAAVARLQQACVYHRHTPLGHHALGKLHLNLLALHGRYRLLSVHLISVHTPEAPRPRILRLVVHNIGNAVKTLLSVLSVLTVLLFPPALPVKDILPVSPLAVEPLLLLLQGIILLVQRSHSVEVVAAVDGVNLLLDFLRLRIDALNPALDAPRNALRIATEHLQQSLIRVLRRSLLPQMHRPCLPALLDLSGRDARQRRAFLLRYACSLRSIVYLCIRAGALRYKVSILIPKDVLVEARGIGFGSLLLTLVACGIIGGKHIFALGSLCKDNPVAVAHEHNMVAVVGHLTLLDGLVDGRYKLIHTVII